MISRDSQWPFGFSGSTGIRSLPRYAPAAANEPASDEVPLRCMPSTRIAVRGLPGSGAAPQRQGSGRPRLAQRVLRVVRRTGTARVEAAHRARRSGQRTRVERRSDEQRGSRVRHRVGATGARVGGLCVSGRRRFVRSRGCGAAPDAAVVGAGGRPLVGPAHRPDRPRSARPPSTVLTQAEPEPR